MRAFKLMSYILTSLLLFCLIGCYRTEKVYKSEYFTYCIREWYMEGKYVSILELTEKGQEQETIIIPAHIGGIPVREMGYFKKGSWEEAPYYYYFKSNNLKRVYIEFDNPISTRNINPYMFSKYCPNIEKVMFLYYDYPRASWQRILHFPAFFRSDFLVDYRGWKKEGDKISFDETTVLPASVSYMYNYEGAPNNEYYWIDDYENELIKYKPHDPVREGYTFEGWYKNNECSETWDFETDIIPERIVEEHPKFKDYQHYTYVETKLYAKWKKISN